MDKGTFRALIAGIIVGAYIDWGVFLSDVVTCFDFTLDLVADAFNETEKDTEALVSNMQQ